jgi:uncharacterized membrane protein (DUF4010 family)
MIEALPDVALQSEVAKIAISIALGLFLGLEREWSRKPAGIRTFSLVTLLGTILTLIDVHFCAPGLCMPIIAAAGGVLVVLVAAVLAIGGLVEEEKSMYLTTAVGLFIAYGVGVLVALDKLVIATIVTVITSVLLVYKHELHGLAWGLTESEIRSAGKFAILAFVIYPLLPSKPIPIPVLNIGIELRVVWLMVVFVAGLGMANYALVRAYGTRGVAVTGFFGGLASSTPVVGSMLDFASQHPKRTKCAVSAVVLAIAAMALRNLLLAVLFTDPAGGVFHIGAPLGAIVIGGIVLGLFDLEWGEDVEFELESPFSMRTALMFGVMFAVVTVAGTLAQTYFGATGLLVTTFISGFGSSAAAITSVVVLFRSGTIGTSTLTLGVLFATAGSILVKVGLAISSPNREFTKGVVSRTTFLLALAGFVAVLVAW